MASLRCLHPTHPHLHRGSALLAISNRCFNHSSLLNRTLSVNPPRTAPPRAMAKPSFSTAQDLVASPGDFEFAQPLKIVEYPDPRLRARNKRIVAFDDSLKKLVHEMFDVMYKTDGIGLSAPQLGINVQLMVFNPVGERGEGEEIVLVNPRVSQYSKKLTLFNEGCLSFPGINADVKCSVFIWFNATAGWLSVRLVPLVLFVELHFSWWRKGIMHSLSCFWKAERLFLEFSILSNLPSSVCRHLWFAFVCLAFLVCTPFVLCL
ncbi:Peptide deformylase 1B, chloroplastic [Glycine soja]|uniref:Peptide deformylase n=1 Tax=Glycine soja TaxID=3848 RepID=A0A445FF45_GLYSO|nr:Peptide deformylase 1B, chloroplastic [Glycine soja]